jgi:2,4'-dihydroxyacetophenone dioxygenase
MSASSALGGWDVHTHNIPPAIIAAGAGGRYGMRTDAKTLQALTRRRTSTENWEIQRRGCFRAEAASTNLLTDRHTRREHEVATMKTPEGAPSFEEILIQSEQMAWREKSLKGIHEKMLWRNEQTGASIALIKFDKGAGIPQPHLHAANQFMFCLKGKYEYTATKTVLTTGCFYCNPKGNVHGPTIAHEETIVIEIYDGPHYPQKPSWYTDERDAH